MDETKRTRAALARPELYPGPAVFHKLRPDLVRKVSRSVIDFTDHESRASTGRIPHYWQHE